MKRVTVSERVRTPRGGVQTFTTGNAAVISTWAFFALGLVVIYLLYRLVVAVEGIAYGD